MIRPRIGDRVQWKHTNDEIRKGTVEDIDELIGVRADDGELVYVEEFYLEPTEAT
ncbi:hypothetical protein MSP7336_01831 [Mycobacterium shimoidei]|uniref:Hypervirulence associated protein TUDOR domain-containing protein n=1 Tax=Mycobacterium shimoidei TaxID=29313 RepID=A0A375YXN7_MYCSH|nr:hypothetical protein [Mycobacterium shimoidei]SRX93592.1 hypothetical protein MSP7336_01831 [Mycobacterium shimoidei]